MQAMILAAGMGTRLLPHSALCPKPLFPILNRPLLLLTIGRLKNFGFKKIFVNCHHLKRQIVEALAGLEGVVVLEEETILGTGGGLGNAYKYIDPEPLLVTNGDIYHTVDLADFYDYHCRGRSEGKITLAMHDYPRFNSVPVIDNRVVDFGRDGKLKETLFAFTGLHMIDPPLLKEIEPDKYSCIVDHYRRLLDDGISIECFRVDDCYWSDMGTPEDYLKLHEGLLTGRIPIWPEIGESMENTHLQSACDLPSDIKIHDWAAIGKVEIGQGCSLGRVVVWDGVKLPAGSKITDQIISS